MTTKKYKKKLKILKNMTYALPDRVRLLKNAVKKIDETRAPIEYLPTIQELQSIINYEKVGPACDFKDTKSEAYWSSMAHPADTSFAWGVYFGTGYTSLYDKDSKRYVRYVKEKKDGTLKWSKTSQKTMTYNETLEWAKILPDDDIYRDEDYE